MKRDKKLSRTEALYGKRCKCGGIIFADTEDWDEPLCHPCYVLYKRENSKKELKGESYEMV